MEVLRELFQNKLRRPAAKPAYENLSGNVGTCELYGVREKQKRDTRICADNHTRQSNRLYAADTAEFFSEQYFTQTAEILYFAVYNGSAAFRCRAAFGGVLGYEDISRLGQYNKIFADNGRDTLGVLAYRENNRKVFDGDRSGRRNHNRKILSVFSVPYGDCAEKQNRLRQADANGFSKVQQDLRYMDIYAGRACGAAQGEGDRHCSRGKFCGTV